MHPSKVMAHFCVSEKADFVLCTNCSTTGNGIFGGMLALHSTNATRFRSYSLTRPREFSFDLIWQRFSLRALFGLDPVRQRVLTSKGAHRFMSGTWATCSSHAAWSPRLQTGKARSATPTKPMST